MFHCFIPYYIKTKSQYLLLHRGAKDNKQMLIEYTLKSTSASPSTLNVAPFEDQILSISSIPSQSTAQSFYVEGEISLPSEFQFFFRTSMLLMPTSNTNQTQKESSLYQLQARENVDSKM